MRAERRRSNHRKPFTLDPNLWYKSKKTHKIMALKVKAKEQYQNIGKYAGKYRYVMMPELYTALTQDKVIKEAALRSGVSKGVMQACWDAAGEVIKAWATEGHSVALPGLGTMRFGLRAKSVEKVEEVKAGLISSRRIIFTPDIDLKEELSKTAVQITCFDRNGKEVKRVTSTDSGDVEDPENDNQNENGNGTSQNSGSGSQNQGGNTSGGSNTGGGNSGGGNSGGSGGMVID
jgi:predicted histone-like DNA-binding protein